MKYFKNMILALLFDKITLMALAVTPSQLRRLPVADIAQTANQGAVRAPLLALRGPVRRRRTRNRGRPRWRRTGGRLEGGWINHIYTELPLVFSPKF